MKIITLLIVNLILVPPIQLQPPHYINSVCSIGVLSMQEQPIENKLELFSLESFSDTELQVLYNIVEAEVTGGSAESKYNVACVILNRTTDYEFPGNIPDVVFQRKQFSPIADGRYGSLEITDSTIDGAYKALYDEQNGQMSDLHRKALYFCNKKYVTNAATKRWFNEELEELFTDDAGHTFYGRKE